MPTLRALQIAYVLVRAGAVAVARRLGADEHGEGVISTAIAVLVMAFLGALMWVGFRQIWSDSEQRIAEQTDRIGGDG
jgi:hypothetical protein